MLKVEIAAKDEAGLDAIMDALRQRGHDQQAHAGWHDHWFSVVTRVADWDAFWALKATMPFDVYFDGYIQ